LTPLGSAGVIRADARNLPLSDASVDLIVTSPPYFGLRSYTDGGEHYDGQIGAEATPQEYVAALLECTREWMRVLKPEGSIFVDLGDKYSGAQGQTNTGRGMASRTVSSADVWRQTDPARTGIPNKSLMLLPERYRIGCVDELGLIARAVILWSKSNGMPESVTDRVRRSHEDWVHLTRRPRYYSAVDEIREQHTAPTRTPGANSMGGHNANLPRTATGAYDGPNPLGKLPGSVWEIATQPLKVPDHLEVDHYAAFPTEWPRRIIAGWSPPGICTACAEGRRPTVSSVGLDMSRPQARRAHALAEKAGLTEEHLAALLSVGVSDTGRGAATQSGTGKNRAEVYVLADEARTALGGYAREYLLRRPTGLAYVCECATLDAPTRPALIVDPFGGTGTTALAAKALGRNALSFDLSHDYARLADWRTNDPGELARVLGKPKPPKQVTGQIGFDFEEAS
jgi:DNA modification methylase